MELGERWIPDAEAGVRWVATSELPDPSPFLEGGEILLTTGLNTASWTTEWQEYVARLVAANVSAVGFGVGLTHTTVPARLVEAAAGAGLNLFVVPRATPFVSISRAVAQLLDSAEQAVSREATTMQRELAQAAMRSDGAAAIVEKIATMVHGRASIVDKAGMRIVNTGASQITGDEHSSAQPEIVRLGPLGLRGAASVSDAGGHLIIHPLGLRGQPREYLVVVAPDHWTPGRRSVVTTAVALLSMDAESRAARLDVDRRLRSRAVVLLLGRETELAETVLSLAETAVADKTLVPGRLRVLRSEGDGSILERVLTRVEAEGRFPVLASLVPGEGTEQATLVALVPPDGVDIWERALTEAGTSTGIGEAVSQEEIRRSDQGSREALARAGVHRRWVRWDDVAAEGLPAVLDSVALSLFAHRTLAPIKALPDGDELVRTLLAFLTHHGHRGRVADELLVHRNTVRRRITQVEGVLGRSLDDPQTRVDLWIALHLPAENE